MPVYEYGPKGGVAGCDHCRRGFDVLQRMVDEPLAACPKCGCAVERLIQRPAISTPKTNTELKNLGFTKLVKRDTGVYENVTQTGSESRYMERGKADTIPDIRSKVGD